MSSDADNADPSAMNGFEDASQRSDQQEDVPTDDPLSDFDTNALLLIDRLQKIHRHWSTKLKSDAALDENRAIAPVHVRSSIKSISYNAYRLLLELSRSEYGSPVQQDTFAHNAFILHDNSFPEKFEKFEIASSEFNARIKAWKNEVDLSTLSVLLKEKMISLCSEQCTLLVVSLDIVRLFYQVLSFNTSVI